MAKSKKSLASEPLVLVLSISTDEAGDIHIAYESTDDRAPVVGPIVLKAIADAIVE